MKKNKKNKSVGIGNINYRIKTFLDKGVTKEEIFEVIKHTEDFNPAYWDGDRLISDAQAKKAGLEIIDPKVLQGLSEALPTWQQLKKTSEYDDIEDILSNFFAHETVGDVLGEFRSQYYDLMNKIAAQYGFTGSPSTRIARAEALVLSNKDTKAVIDKARIWGEKYHDKKNNPMSYQDAIKGLKDISNMFDSVPGVISNMLNRNKGVRT